ncbi:Saccharolysin [Venturia nashicola]|nr:Saccharolysin [Venturia nashicola]
MGIHGIYKEIGPGQRIALSKLAVDKFEETGRPLRIAIDISIWLFQIQASKGGTNPALRTFYYRLLRLISHSIHPLFVFDGPNKPPFKRSKRTGPNVASIPEFLAKQLLKQFGLVFHIAPGEAEAECALLQREGIVDAVLSEDVDTLMFGSGITLRNWSAEVGKSNKTPSHVNLYDAKKTKDASGLDREGMILIALMSGGDYVPEGIPGCGPKIACEAARAGFGHELYKIPKKDKVALCVWREKLAYELRTNESKFFKCKHKALKIPDDFPNPDVLGYYTTPCVSPLDKVERLRQSLQWDQDINFGELRTFTGDAFDWTKLGGAKKFIRNLAPALLVKELRMRGQIEDRPSEDIDAIQEQEAKFVAGIHGRRNHATTDGVPELRVSFTPHDLVPIDLTVEEPDDEYPAEDDSDEEAGPVVSDEAPTSPSKKRGPSTYDPTKPEKIWVFETYVKVGAPLKTQDWEASQRVKQDALDKKAANKNAPKAVKSTKGKKKAAGGPLDVFTAVVKPGQAPLLSLTDKMPPISSLTMSIVSKEPLLESGSQRRSQSREEPIKKPSTRARPKPKDTTQVVAKPQSTQQNTIIDLLSSPAKRCSRPIETHSRSSSVVQDLSSYVTKRRRSPLRRSQTDTAVLDMTEDLPKPTSVSFTLKIPASLSPPLSPSQPLPTKRTKRLGTQSSLSQKPTTPSRRKRQDTVDLCSSPARQTDITNYFTPSKVRHADARKDNEAEHSQRPESPSPVVEALDLTMSPVRSSKRAPPTPSDLGRAARIRPRPAQSQFSMDSHFAALPRVKPSTSRPQPPAKPPITSSRCTLPPTSQTPAELDLTGIEPVLVCPKAVKSKSKANVTKTNPGRAAQSSIRRSPRFKSTVMHDNSIVTPVITAKRKQIIRVRDSVPGAFAVEELDLTGDLPAMSKGKFRISGVGVLDLTGV